MKLIFDPSELTERGRGLTYDDVLLVPKKSEIRSRTMPSLKSSLTTNLQMDIPFISANMDTITEAPMAKGMSELGGFGILHRFMTIEHQCDQVRSLKQANVATIGASIGVNGDFQDRAQGLIEAGANVLTIDIAHGHSVAMCETLEWLRAHHPSIQIIAGNVATPQACEDLISAGAHAVKVGIGPGSMCTTRTITGCGVPQLTAVALCAPVCARLQVPLIADGGIKTSGDIVKALAAGASTVMLGSLLSGVIETPGEIRNGRKRYRGMASRDAQDSWRGGVPMGMAPEGESTSVPVKGHLVTVINELTGGLRSGMTYLNASNLQELRENAQFIELSPQGVMESVAHGLFQR